MKVLLIILISLITTTCIWAQDFKFGKVSKEELLEKSHPLDPSANAAVLYREVESNFEYVSDKGFYLTTDVFERIKLYNKEGFDWATKIIDLYQGSGGDQDQINGLKGYTYYLDADKIVEVKLKSDGIFETEANKYLNQTTFTMPDLREGCVIEYKYKLVSPFIGDIDEFKFQETIPVNMVNARFSSPEYFNFKTHQRGWIIYNIGTDARERTLNLGSQTSRASEGKYQSITTLNQSNDLTFNENIYNIDLKNVPALNEEAFSGNIENYATALKFELAYIQFPSRSIKSYSTTWDDISKNINASDSFGDEIDRSGYFEKDLEAVLKDASTKDEKMLAIFNFVKNKMNWNSLAGYYTQAGVKSAYNKGVGNVAEINLMLVAMMRKAGLNASPVILSTKNHGIPLFPTRNGFNYVVAAVERDKDIVLLDATGKNAEMGIMPTYALNWQGRLIRKDDSSAWVPLTPNAPASQNSMINIVLGDDLSIEGVAQNKMTGHYALNYRDSFEDVDENEARKVLEEKLHNAELSNIKFENLDETTQPVLLNYNFKAYDMAEEISGKIYFSPMGFLSEKENPFKLDKRQYPIDFEYARKDRYFVNIDLPEGYKVESLPADSALILGERTGNFKYAIKEFGNKLQLFVELAINESMIAADDYESLKKFYQMVIEKENEKVVLVKG